MNSAKQMIQSETRSESNYTGMQLSHTIWFYNHTKLYSDYHTAAFINLMFDFNKFMNPSLRNPTLVFSNIQAALITYVDKVPSNKTNKIVLDHCVVTTVFL